MGPPAREWGGDTDGGSGLWGSDGTLQSEHVVPRGFHNSGKGKNTCGTRPGGGRVGHDGQLRLRSCAVWVESTFHLSAGVQGDDKLSKEPHFGPTLVDDKPANVAKVKVDVLFGSKRASQGLEHFLDTHLYSVSVKRCHVGENGEVQGDHRDLP